MEEQKIIDCYLSEETCGSQDYYNYEGKPCGSHLLEVEYDQDVDELGIESSVKDCLICSANSEDQQDFYLDILDKLTCAVCDEKADIKNGEFRDIVSYRDQHVRFSCDECSKWKLIQDAENHEMLWEDDGISKLFFFHDERFFTGLRFDNKFQITGSENSFFITEKDFRNKVYIENDENTEDLLKFASNSEVGDVHYGAEYNSNIDVYRIR